MIDCHNHLQDSRLDFIRDAAITYLRASGVKVWGVNGTQESDWTRVLSLAQECGEVFPSLGLHPWQVKERTSEWDRRLETMIDSRLESGMPVAVGEIGLDKWIRDADIKDQEIVFRRQLEIAIERDLPVTIHCLQCWGRMLGVLREIELSSGFLLHSYSGPSEMIEEFCELGAYFSFSGYFLHQRKSDVRERFQNRIPIDRVLLETDAPDMLLPDDADRFGSGTLNHPGNIEVIYERFAQLIDIPLEALRQQMQHNFGALFGDRSVTS